jgi:hypothetical protein
MAVTLIRPELNLVPRHVVHRAQPEFVVLQARPTDGNFLWRVVGVETNRTLSRHRSLPEAMRAAKRLNKHSKNTELHQCEYARGEFRCSDIGVVQHLENLLELCYAHYLQAEIE